MTPFDMAKVEEAAKGRDYYANLTDEERAEEGLPPREPEPKPDPEPAPAPDPDADEEEEEEELPSEEATDRLLEEIKNLREDLSDRVGKEPTATKKAEDAFMEAALEHDDPIVRGLAEELQTAKAELAAIKDAARERLVADQLKQDNQDFDYVQKNYLIGGRPMTDAQVEQVENWILEHPNAGRELTIEQATRSVFPDAVKARPRSPSANGPGDSRNGRGSPVATIVDEGSTGGGAPTGPWKPRPNETIESAIQEAGKRLFGVKP